MSGAGSSAGASASPMPLPAPARAPEETETETEAGKPLKHVFLLTVVAGGSGYTSQVAFTDQAVAERKHSEFFDMGCEVSLRRIVLDPHLQTK